MYLLMATVICFLAANSPCSSAIAPPDIGIPDPACPQFIKCLKPCHVSIGDDGCRTCECPEDCRTTKCPVGQVCRNLCSTTNKTCENYQCVPACKPVNCTNKCLSGYWYDSNGCKTCRCKNVCENILCKANETCVPRNITSPAVGYDCLPMTKLCCPKPTLPEVCAIQNICKSCRLSCNFLCLKGLKCCPDWYGCQRCVKPVPC